MINGQYPSLVEVQQLLPDVVLLVVETGTKKPIRRAWQKTTFADTQKPGYQKHLSLGTAISALLGPPSNWLTDVDCDTDAFLQFMLAHNEPLRHTLHTRGARAGGLWFRNLDHTLKRVYPLTLEANSPLTKGGKIDEKTGLVKIGELRCGGGHSIVCGLHPDGIHYQWLCQPPAGMEDKRNDGRADLVKNRRHPRQAPEMDIERA